MRNIFYILIYTLPAHSLLQLRFYFYVFLLSVSKSASPMRVWIQEIFHNADLDPDTACVCFVAFLTKTIGTCTNKYSDPAGSGSATPAVKNGVFDKQKYFLFSVYLDFYLNFTEVRMKFLYCVFFSSWTWPKMFKIFSLQC